MNRSLTYKIGAIALLILLLIIPLMMINGIINDRQNLRDGVLDDIARSSSYSQKITGPVMVVPYRRTVREWKTDDKGENRKLETRIKSGRLYFLPERFELDGKVQAELRARGIYEARLYHANNRISGHFQIPAQYGIGDDLPDYRFETPYLSVGISDIRGIENALTLEHSGETLSFVPGSQVDWLGDGVHVDLPKFDVVANPRLDFAFDLALQGTSNLKITPVGKTSEVRLTADWPHPSFIGNYLPTQREITDVGFAANWRSSFFSTNLEEVMDKCWMTTQCEDFNERSFGVSFIDPVDQYLKTDRSIKYALLFIALTFAGFFLFEILKKLAVHPIQYALVGAALALFYLLLLSLSEHLGFTLAYLLSASACVLLIGFYVCHVLRSLAHGMGFAAGLAVLYALLFGLMGAEDYALLMGALLLFGLLGVFMVLTRKLDWYSVVQLKPAETLDFNIEAVHE